jgi:hypothetical protein
MCHWTVGPQHRFSPMWVSKPLGGVVVVLTLFSPLLRKPCFKCTICNQVSVSLCDPDRIGVARCGAIWGLVAADRVRSKGFDIAVVLRIVEHIVNRGLHRGPNNDVHNTVSARKVSLRHVRGSSSHSKVAHNSES